MTEPTLPAFHDGGYVTDPEKIMTMLFANAFVNNKSQSKVFNNQIVSMQYMVHQYAKDPGDFVREARQALQTMYARYYQHVEVEVTYKYKDGEDGIYEVNFGIEATAHNGVTYVLEQARFVNPSQAIISLEASY